MQIGSWRWHRSYCVPWKGAQRCSTSKSESEWYATISWPLTFSGRDFLASYLQGTCPGRPGNPSIRFRFALGGGAEAIVCLGRVLNGAPPPRANQAPPLHPSGDVPPGGQKVVAYHSDSLLEVAPKLLCALEGCSTVLHCSRSYSPAG